MGQHFSVEKYIIQVYYYYPCRQCQALLALANLNPSLSPSIKRSFITGHSSMLILVGGVVRLAIPLDCSTLLEYHTVTSRTGPLPIRAIPCSIHSEWTNIKCLGFPRLHPVLPISLSYQIPSTGIIKPERDSDLIKPAG